jgi:Ca-activated chloride channel family protein
MSGAVTGFGRAALVGTLLLCHGGAAAPVTSQEAIYRARTDLIVLQVAVVDQQHRFVAGLEREDFVVYEEGVAQPIALFASTKAPLDALVVLDTSSSMTGRMELAQDAAITLLGALRASDRAGLVVFNNSVAIAHQLSEDLAAAMRAIRGAQPGGATALHEAVYVALHDLARAGRASAEGEARRQALIVLSDGADNRSRVRFDDVLESARRGSVTIFTVLPAHMAELSVPTLGRDHHGDETYNMRRLAEETGGRAFTPKDFSELGRIYADISSELGQQYWLAYAPSATARPGFRRLSVRVATRPELRARTRSGYYASAPGERRRPY